MALNTLPNAGLTSRGYPSDRLVTPLIINGDMSVAQRGTSATGLTNGSSGFHTVDRFRYSEAGAPSSQITMTQDTNVPTGQGFVTAMKFDVTTAQGSMSAADRVTFDQKIEAQNLQLLKYGTSNAEKLTLCFWVKATKTGTYVVWIYSPDGNRSVAKQYTMSASDTWEKKTINIPADTAGTINNDIGEGFRVSWFIAAGSNFTSGTLASSWESHTAANTAVGQVNATDSTSNNWHITGIQLEVGEFDSTSIPSFPFESFENNLQRCERYFEINEGGFYGPVYSTASDMRASVPYRVQKRANPTVTQISGEENCCSSTTVTGNSIDPTLGARVQGTNVFSAGATKFFNVKFSADSEL
tara:strand:- start:245 stop:1312 length:1068 start_codon:yes stop_codon:yes gene_type:complete